MGSMLVHCRQTSLAALAITTAAGIRSRHSISSYGQGSGDGRPESYNRYRPDNSVPCADCDERSTCNAECKTFKRYASKRVTVNMKSGGWQTTLANSLIHHWQMDLLRQHSDCCRDLSSMYRISERLIMNPRTRYRKMPGSALATNVNTALSALGNVRASNIMLPAKHQSL